jgi:hypothetical protein
MTQFIMQLQLALTALAALLPLAPEKNRAKLAALFDIAADALRAGAAGAQALENLAPKMKRLRAEIERLAETGRPISAEDLDAAMANVSRASAAFRKALKEAEG